MRYSSRLRSVSIAAVFVAVLGTPMVAMTQDAQDAGDKAIKARQGFMQVVGWEAGPLFGMAKGDVAYDADTAKAHAANMQALTHYAFPSLFLAGTSKGDRPGKTRAEAKVWEDMAGFEKAMADFAAAADGLVKVAGNGQQELAAAVGELGKSCGGCHKPYRAKDF